MSRPGTARAPRSRPGAGGLSASPGRAAQSGRGGGAHGTRRAGRERVAGSPRFASGRGRPEAGRPEGAGDEALCDEQFPSRARSAPRGGLRRTFCLWRLERPSRRFQRVPLVSPLGAIGWVHRFAPPIRARPPWSTRGRRGRPPHRVDSQRRWRPAQRSSGRSELSVTRGMVYQCTTEKNINKNRP